MRIYAQQMTAQDIAKIARSTKRDKRLNLADALKDIYTGASALFKTNKTVYTVQAGDNLLHVAQLCGDMADIKQISEDVDALARSMNKRYIDIDGRKGWARVLRPYGYRPFGKLLRKTL